MPAVLTGPVTIRVDGRRVLRGSPVRRGLELILVEDNGDEVSVRSPVAVLLARSDLIAALNPDGALIETFWEGSASFRLRLNRVPGGSRLSLQTPDGEDLDAHLTPIRSLLPQQSWS